MTPLDDHTTLPAFAGVGGAIVGALATDGITPWRAVTMIVAGGITSMFVAPATSDYFGIISRNGIAFVGFMVGMLGLIAAQVVTGLARKDGRSLLKRWLGGGQ